MPWPRYSKGWLYTPDGAFIPHVTIGSGPAPVVVLPGAGDGVMTATDAALGLAWFYRRRAREHRLLVLSRRQPIPPGYSAEQHAEDMIWAITRLGWPPSTWECNSAGGPIGQWAAVKRPDLVQGLVLSSTLHRGSEQTGRVLVHWLALIREGRWGDALWSSLELTFRPRTVRRCRALRPLLRWLVPVRYPHRLEHILEGLLDLDNREILPRIACLALVIGGEEDRIIPAEVQREMAERIPAARLELSAGYGHGNDLENPDYVRQVRAFVSSPAVEP